MKWLPIILSCALMACAVRSAPPPLQASGDAWLVFIDDMHLDFRNTGRLRDLLRMVARDVIKDGDVFMVRSSGPSLVSIDWTVDRSLFQSQIRFATGNALRPSDRVNTGRDPLFEVRYRAGIAMAFASELVSAARAVRARHVNLVYVSNGYDLEEPAFRTRLLRLAELARASHVRIFPINARLVFPRPIEDVEADAEGWAKHLETTQASLKLLAEETGGFAVENRQSADSAVRKIAALR